MSADYRKVFVRDYRLDIVIGVHDFEKVSPQALDATVELYVGTTDSPKSDALDDVLNYECIPETLERIAAEPPIELLETFAEKLLCAFFDYAQVKAVRIRLEKPDICPKAQAMGYEIYRVRA